VCLCSGPRTFIFSCLESHSILYQVRHPVHPQPKDCPGPQGWLSIRPELVQGISFTRRQLLWTLSDSNCPFAFSVEMGRRSLYLWHLYFFQKGSMEESDEDASTWLLVHLQAGHSVNLCLKLPSSLCRFFLSRISSSCVEPLPYLFWAVFIFRDLMVPDWQQQQPLPKKPPHWVAIHSSRPAHHRRSLCGLGIRLIPQTR
jgi:hypothetical protein